MLQGNRVIPYFDRSQIDSGDNPLAGNELIWLMTATLFSSCISRLGRVQLPDGSIVGVGSATRMGILMSQSARLLIQWEELSREEISLFTIRQWLEQNPERADELLFNNPSYVFFVLRKIRRTARSGRLTRS